MLRQAVLLIRREFPGAFPTPARPSSGQRPLGAERPAPLDG
jgi:hypothetical protein